MKEQQQLSAKQLKQRKFLMALPILVLPFLTFFFWFFGGGTMSESMASEQLTGINSEIPTAKVSDQPADKLRYYEQAEKDSARLEELQRNDPYYNSYLREQEFDPYAKDYGSLISDSPGKSYYAREYQASPERKVLDKLQELNASLQQAEAGPVAQQPASYSFGKTEALSTSDDIAKLEQMMTAMQQGGNQDPEMSQINGMLETILDIQHPERVQERLKQTSEERKGQVFAVAPYKNNDVITSMATDNQPVTKATISTVGGNGFYSLENSAEASLGQQAIEAVIHEAQTLTTGSTVKLRLMGDVFINGRLIPKDNFVFGTAILNGERLEISIDHIRYGASLFPVSLNVHDMDGMEGVYIPGAITRDVMKQSGDQSLQGLGMMSMSPSLGMQAASAGIELGKNLLSRKIRLVKVQVKAGYKVLLIDQNQKRNNN